MGKGKNNAYLPNVQWMLEAGIDPKTKLPMKLGLSDPVNLKENIKKYRAHFGNNCYQCSFSQVFFRQ